MSEFFQACYAHPDTGWAVINTSADIPDKLAEDFSLVERSNAGMASAKAVQMGESENPTCMFEVYSKNDAVGVVRTQFGLSDGQGRPISFSHGYIFPDAYEALKNPQQLLGVSNDCFASGRIDEATKAEIRSTPGALNNELIRLSSPDMIPEELSLSETYSINSALEICGMNAESYKNYMLVVYAHILLAKSENNLYIKTDGSEKYARNLLYLTYMGIPYSMRTLISASTYLREGQHNSKLIFCYEVPDGVPHIEPKTGENNVVNDVVKKRTEERNPFIGHIVDKVIKGNPDEFYRESLEMALTYTGNVRLNSAQAINTVYSLLHKDFENADKVQGLLYGWLSLPVQNTSEWEKIALGCIQHAEKFGVKFGDEVKEVLSTKSEGAVTDDFKIALKRVLNS